MLKISVLIASYRRPQCLARCLAALQQQTRLPDEIVIVTRDADTETLDFLAAANIQPLTLRIVAISAPGVVAALNAGVEATQGDIIAITDDDAVPHPPWLEQLEHYYLADSQVGAVGGRDRVFHGDRLETGAKPVAGMLQWYGRIVGNHHLGTGSARPVDVLKGVNMSFRRRAIAGIPFDARMQGQGAQVHFEVAFCLALQRAGWLLIYDPQITVDHYPAQRFDEDQRHQFNSVAFTNAVHNETLAVLEHLPPWRRWVFGLWAILVGTRAAFGLVQLFRFLPSEGALAGRKWLASIQGRYQGWKTWRQRKVAYV